MLSQNKLNVNRHILNSFFKQKRKAFLNPSFSIMTLLPLVVLSDHNEIILEKTNCNGYFSPFSDI